MNEYLIVFLIALLFFNLPKIFGYTIKSLGLKEINLIFAEGKEKNQKLFPLQKSNNKS